MFFRSLRFRITSMAMVVVVAALVVVGVVLLQAVKSHLLGQVDQGLSNGVAYDAARIVHHEYLPSTSPAGELGQFFLPNGTLIGSSVNLKGQPPLVHVDPRLVAPRFMTIHTDRFGYVRLLEQHIGSAKGPILVSGQAINQIVDAEHSLTVLLVVLLPLLAVGLAVLIWLVVGRAMRRVEDVRAAVADISVGQLDERVPSSRSGDELDRLVGTMNVMLERLQGGVERERQFIADASHELRSPIASLRAALETDDPRGEGTQRSHEVALSELQRLDMLADELLTLDSLNGRRKGPPPRLVDLDELVLAQAEQVRRRSLLEIDVSGVSAGQVLAREVDMMRIIENLSSNATRHARTCVSYSVREADRQVTLSVTDDGPGIPEPLRHDVFERFTRVETDRAHRSGSGGLGLAIVSELVKTYHGQVWVETAEPHGARFLVRLPVAG